jgi:hypothetical protein
MRKLCVLFSAAASVALMAFGVGGCDEYKYRYFAHSDKVTLGAGDAPASNLATHTVDPWPKHSQRTKIDQDGKRAAIAVKRYETNTSIRPKGLTNSNGNGGDLLPPLGANGPTVKN